MSLRSMSNTGRERREEEEEAQTPSQTDTILIIASNHRQDSLPTSHLPERERECLCVTVCPREQQHLLVLWR